MTVNFEGMEKDSLIYDFETLSVKASNGVALSCGAITFDSSRFISVEPYTYEELLEEAEYFKFIVSEQVEKYGRKITKETLAWWGDQGPEARKVLDPSSHDRSLTELHSWLVGEVIKGTDLQKVYTRGNTFDPIFLESLLEAVDKEIPYGWWTLRDTRSVLEGLSWGHDISNKFIPDGLQEKFTAHDARHDCVMDVMRMQTLVQAIQ